MSSNTNNKRRRRAYIGNIRPRPNLSESLYNDLFLPHCLQVKNYPGDNGITVALPKSHHHQTASSSSSSSAYALVEFTDVDYAIQVLNGVQFDGRILRVSREKTNFGTGTFGGGGRKKGGGKFGSTRWAGDDNDREEKTKRYYYDQRQSKNEKIQADTQTTQVNSGSTGWAGDDNDREEKTKRYYYEQRRSKNEKIQADTHTTQVNSANYEEDISEQVKSMISNEIKESEDEVTAAIACTAAMTLLSSVDAFGLDDDQEDSNNINNQNVDTSTLQSDMAHNDFKSRCALPMSDLLAEYGEQDVNWKTNKVVEKNKQNDDTNVPFKSQLKPLSDLMAEYGEKDVDWKKQQHHPSSSNSNSNSRQNKRNKDGNKSDDNGMLAPFGKAPIHLEIMSCKCISKYKVMFVLVFMSHKQS